MIKYYAIYKFDIQMSCNKLIGRHVTATMYYPKLRKIWLQDNCIKYHVLRMNKRRGSACRQVFHWASKGETYDKTRIRVVEVKTRDYVVVYLVTTNEYLTLVSDFGEPATGDISLYKYLLETKSITGKIAFAAGIGSLVFISSMLLWKAVRKFQKINSYIRELETNLGQADRLHDEKSTLIKKLHTRIHILEKKLTSQTISNEENDELQREHSKYIKLLEDKIKDYDALGNETQKITRNIHTLEDRNISVATSIINLFDQETGSRWKGSPGHRHKALTYISHMHKNVEIYCEEIDIIYYPDEKEFKHIVRPVSIRTNNTNVRFLAFVLNLKKHGDKYRHANILLFDKTKKILSRFEPYGQSTPFEGETYLDSYIKRSVDVPFEKYIEPSRFCPQAKGGKRLKNDPLGFCMVWVIWYLDLRLTYPDVDEDKLQESAIAQIDNEYSDFKQFIRQYAAFLVTLIENNMYEDIAVQND